MMIMMMQMSDGTTWQMGMGVMKTTKMMIMMQMSDGTTWGMGMMMMM